MLAVQPRAFVVTTDSQHELEVYLNLASRMKLTGINQLWVADITYIRLKAEFVCARLQTTGGVRAGPRVGNSFHRSDYEFFQACGGLSTRWC